MIPFHLRTLFIPKGCLLVPKVCIFAPEWYILVPFERVLSHLYYFFECKALIKNQYYTHFGIYGNFNIHRIFTLHKRFFYSGIKKFSTHFWMNYSLKGKYWCLFKCFGVVQNEYKSMFNYEKHLVTDCNVRITQYCCFHTAFSLVSCPCKSSTSFHREVTL